MPPCSALPVSRRRKATGHPTDRYTPTENVFNDCKRRKRQSFSVVDSSSTNEILLPVDNLMGILEETFCCVIAGLVPNSLPTLMSMARIPRLSTTTGDFGHSVWPRSSFVNVGPRPVFEANSIRGRKIKTSDEGKLLRYSDVNAGSFEINRR
jgi:hypothetical protein